MQLRGHNYQNRPVAGGNNQHYDPSFGYDQTQTHNYYSPSHHQHQQPAQQQQRGFSPGPAGQQPYSSDVAFSPGQPVAPQPVQSFNPQAWMTQPFMQQQIADMGIGVAHSFFDNQSRRVEEVITQSKLKYYFAVDTSYVSRKLGLLLFPFTHKEWAVQYSNDSAVAPRDDVNAPDLYIPVMGFVTYVLVAGLSLGMQGRFDPEQLSIQASSALAWLIIEILLVWFVLYLFNIRADLSYLDLLAFSGYKYFGMIIMVLAGLTAGSLAYWACLLWCGLTLAFFITRTLRIRILSHQEQHGMAASKNRLYFLLFLAAVQPVFMWWLTKHL